MNHHSSQSLTCAALSRSDSFGVTGVQFGKIETMMAQIALQASLWNKFAPVRDIVDNH